MVGLTLAIGEFMLLLISAALWSAGGIALAVVGALFAVGGLILLVRRRRRR